MSHTASHPTSVSPDRQRFARKPLKWIGGTSLAVLLLLGSGRMIVGAFSGSASQTPVATQAVQRQTLPISITANGTINAQRSINLSPKSSGVIERLLVNEGDRVQQGQVIAVMDASNLQGQVLQMQGQLAQQEANLQRLMAGNRPEDIAKAEAQLVEAEANLLQLQAGNRSQEIAQASARLQQAQITLEQKQLDFQRHQSLFDEGAIARQTLDQKRADRDVAQSQVEEAQQNLALQNAGTRPEQIAQAQARVEQQRQTVASLRAGNRIEDIDQGRAQVEAAQGALQNITAQFNDTQITAPFNGIVTKKYADVGAFVSPSMSGSGASASSSSILTLASDRQHVIVNLSEAQLAKVKLGQTVKLKIDAIPGETFTGKVEQIAPQATITQNVTSFEVRVSLPRSDRFKVGMNAEAEFQIGQLENALFVPNAAVVRQAEEAGVYVLDQDGQQRFQPIQIGTTSGGQTEVKSGLNGNEQVLISPPTPRRSGGFSLPNPAGNTQ
ncbi:MAG: efflux RND transporter periplasmic adaptor subunit [Oculatellaceae cyanobacterium Prado106]|jgi:HlyD family secretion protein|nr:efflux RND transporter periplasmic adaptor subunit [Oculatellaceae cyanobacterium Prado106]